MEEPMEVDGDGDETVTEEVEKMDVSEEMLAAEDVNMIASEKMDVMEEVNVTAAEDVDVAEKKNAAQEVHAAEKMPAAGEMPAIEEVSATEKVLAAGQVHGTEKVPAAEEVHGAEKAPAAEEMHGAEKVPAAEEVHGAEKVPAAEEMHGAEKVPAAGEVRAAEEVHGAEKVPAAEEKHGAEKVPAAGKVRATEEVPAAEEVPAVEEMHICSIDQSALQYAKEELRKSFLEKLQAKDSIMEPEVITTIKGFLKTGGHPEEVIESLSGSYRGLAQHCEMLTEWLVALDCSHDTVDRLIEQSLSTLLEKRFTAEIVDQNFEAAQDDVEQWLPELIKHTTWRKLIYSLCEQSPRSKFLMRAIQVISEAGFQHEITNVHTASQQMEIYSRMVLAAIDDFLARSNKGPMTEDYDRALAELSHVVCYSEHTYLITQALLFIIAEEEKGVAGVACRHVAYVLRCEARKYNYQEAYAIHIALLEGVGDTARINDVKQTINTMLCKKSLNPADIIRLYGHYRSSKPPPVEFIQDPFLIDMLVDALFAYEGSKVQPDQRSKYIFLLVYASCGINSGSNSRTRKHIKKEMKGTINAVRRVLDILRSKKTFLKNVPVLLKRSVHPSVAAGMTCYLRGLLLKAEVLTQPEEAHFVLLDFIASNHSCLRFRLFEMLSELYDRQAKLPEPAEMVIIKQRSLVDRFIHLLSTGFALPVLEKITRLFHDGQIDVSLARYFAMDVLDMVAPPYSDEFTEAFLPIVLNREIFDCAAAAKIPLVRQFLSITGTTELAKEHVEEQIVEPGPAETEYEGLIEMLENGTFIVGGDDTDEEPKQGEEKNAAAAEHFQERGETFAEVYHQVMDKSSAEQPQEKSKISEVSQERSGTVAEKSLGTDGTVDMEEPSEKHGTVAEDSQVKDKATAEGSQEAVKTTALDEPQEQLREKQDITSEGEFRGNHGTVVADMEKSVESVKLSEMTDMDT